MSDGMLDFDGPALARTTDPDTSHEAAESMGGKVSAERERILAAVVEMCRTGSDGATAGEVVMHLAYSGAAPQRNCVSSRLSELAARGHLVKSDARRRETTGSLAIVFRVPTP